MPENQQKKVQKIVPTLSFFILLLVSLVVVVVVVVGVIVVDVESISLTIEDERSATQRITTSKQCSYNDELHCVIK